MREADKKDKAGDYWSASCYLSLGGEEGGRGGVGREKMRVSARIHASLSAKSTVTRHSLQADGKLHSGETHTQTQTSCCRETSATCGSTFLKHAFKNELILR